MNYVTEFRKYLSLSYLFSYFFIFYIYLSLLTILSVIKILLNITYMMKGSLRRMFRGISL